jgi:DNA-binding PadR family transcriptional regulator
MPDPLSLLPLPPHDFQVLLTLADGPLHAYGLAKAVEAQPGGRVRLEIGSLYRILARLTTLGVIEEAAGGRGAPASGHETRRRYFRLTPFGRRVAEAESARLEAVLRVARRQKLAPSRSGR